MHDGYALVVSVCRCHTRFSSSHLIYILILGALANAGHWELGLCWMSCVCYGRQSCSKAVSWNLRSHRHSASRSSSVNHLKHQHMLRDTLILISRTAKPFILVQAHNLSRSCPVSQGLFLSDNVHVSAGLTPAFILRLISSRCQASSPLIQACRLKQPQPSHIKACQHITAPCQGFHHSI